MHSNHLLVQGQCCQHFPKRTPWNTHSMECSRGKSGGIRGQPSLGSAARQAPCALPEWQESRPAPRNPERPRRASPHRLPRQPSASRRGESQEQWLPSPCLIALGPCRSPAPANGISTCPGQGAVAVCSLGRLERQAGATSLDGRARHLPATRREGWSVRTTKEALGRRQVPSRHRLPERKVILLVVFTRAEFQEILFDAGKYIYSIDYS